MRLLPWMLFYSSLAAGCGLTSAAGISPGSAAVGRWTPFHSRDFEQGRLDYFYDASSVHRGEDHVVARWKVVGSTGTTTLYVIDIACRNGTFTEKGTLLVDAWGQRRVLPRSELLVDSPIEAGTSSDLFRRAFCR